VRDGRRTTNIMTLGGRTGVSARGDAGCGEVAELELEIGMTRDGGVVGRSHEGDEMM